MGNKSSEEEDYQISISTDDWLRGDFTPYDWDLHSGPTVVLNGKTYTVDDEDPFDSIKAIQNELHEEQLREEHAELMEAWNNYQIVLEKYKFWDKVTK